MESCVSRETVHSRICWQAIKGGLSMSLDQRAARGDFRLSFFFSKEFLSFDIKIDNTSVANISLRTEKSRSSYI